MVSGRMAGRVLLGVVLAAALAVAGCATTGGTSSEPANGLASPPSAVGPATVIPSQGPGYWGPGYRGSAMMGNGSGQWGPNMMSRSRVWGHGMMGGFWQAGDGAPVRTLDQARERSNVFAERLGLQVGEVMQFSWNFYAELRTGTGQLATEILIDPASGAVGIEYGPAMMWNTSYGMHGGNGQPSVSAAQAREIATRWLRDHGSALTVGTADAFPGYYTLHAMQDGHVVGMLSVNASTGAVWYHTWHGSYITTSQ